MATRLPAIKTVITSYSIHYTKLYEVGNFGVVMQRLVREGYAEKIIERIHQDKPTFGICVALQAFFEGSEESPGIAGLGVIPGQVKRFASYNFV